MRKPGFLWPAALALLLASCGGGGEPASPKGTGTVETPRSPTPDTATQTSSAPADGSAHDDGSGGGGGDGEGSDGDGRAACEATESWTLRPDTREGRSGGPVVDVRAGRHDCFDRVVIDIGGAARTGFDVEYQPEVQAQGSGRPVPHAGGAVLEVVVHAPARGTPGGGVGKEPLAQGQEALVPSSRVADWPALRSVRYGGSFEAVTTFAVGVREKLPFRALSQLDEDSGTREVIVDIAHSAG
ncbi:hypothetical protein FZ103_09645 [Streptomonospora sp. PA3]|uniref:AMIN-like domain-containing (lipo)protein n=1 Tax=Streptomonospora sp. PA3 TaxID=2607326 RepID=UPI0012DD35EB|nr:hypothetical protein [Streptomonospora sp. PA3]MUL41433.1 hypothetical protein [Streptomonospora sp. PA3]